MWPPRTELWQRICIYCRTLSLNFPPTLMLVIRIAHRRISLFIHIASRVFAPVIDQTKPPRSYRSHDLCGAVAMASGAHPRCIDGHPMASGTIYSKLRRQRQNDCVLYCRRVEYAESKIWIVIMIVQVVTIVMNYLCTTATARKAWRLGMFHDWSELSGEGLLRGRLLRSIKQNTDELSDTLDYERVSGVVFYKLYPSYGQGYLFAAATVLLRF